MNLRMLFDRVKLSCVDCALHTKTVDDDAGAVLIGARVSGGVGEGCPTRLNLHECSA